jgi:hypothetical protein
MNKKREQAFACLPLQGILGSDFSGVMGAPILRVLSS